MLKELLAEFVKLARESGDASVMNAGETPEPGHFYRFVSPDGVVGELIEAQPHPRQYQMFRLQDLVECVKRAIAQGTPAESILIFCGRGKVTAVLDEAKGRRHTLSIDLPQSHEMRKLMALEQARKPLMHGELLNVLRVDLADAVKPADVDRFRILRFDSRGSAVSDKSAGRDQLGKDVLHEVIAGGEKPPEELVLSVAAYRDLSHVRFPMKVIVNVELAAQTIAVIPVGGELERVTRDTDAQIQRDLIGLLGEEGKGVQVVCGAP